MNDFSLRILQIKNITHMMQEERWLSQYNVPEAGILRSNK